jgi:squalene monooxygenase
MRHPLTGGGMTVAFNDVLLLRELLSPDSVPNLEALPAVQKQIALFHWRRKASSSVINVLAMALYALFAADDSRLVTLQNGCFRYFQKGGMCVAEPVGLLAGLIRERWVLVYHFFAVALYSVLVKCMEGPWWRVPWVLGVEVWCVLWKAVCVIGPYLLAEVRR